MVTVIGWEVVMGRRVVESKALVSCIVPWCLSCGGRLCWELSWSDGGLSTVCWSCGSECAEWPEGDVGLLGVEDGCSVEEVVDE
jgi:hypothetical protein